MPGHTTVDPIVGFELFVFNCFIGLKRRVWALRRPAEYLTRGY
jgi:hypothetical protein